MSIPLVFVCSEKDFKQLIEHLDKFKELITDNIVIIGKSSLQELCKKENINFYDEDHLFKGLTYNNIKQYLTEFGAEKRTGWYFQQFLKMAYCTICDAPYYLIWDADTLPLKKYKIDEFVFDVKTEYNKPYFDTLTNLFAELKKTNDFSFISEHMLFDKKIMLEIINKISSLNRKEDFWKIILSKINKNDLPASGFSEFETYGTYTQYYYPDLYTVRKWKSLRSENDWLEYSKLDNHLMKWLSKSWNALSFEQKINSFVKYRCLYFLSYFFDYNTSSKIYGKIRNVLIHISTICKKSGELEYEYN